MDSLLSICDPPTHPPSIDVVREEASVSTSDSSQLFLGPEWMDSASHGTTD